MVQAMKWCLAIVALACHGQITDENEALRLREKYAALTRSWTRGVTFTQAEQDAMDRGRQLEPLMMKGLDDPLGKKILAAGEPSFAAFEALYPGKVLDRAVIGSYSQPDRQPGDCDDEFVVWWNGAVSANLLKGRMQGAIQPVAHNTSILFRVGEDAEMFGLHGDRSSRLAYERGFLPIVNAAYNHDGFQYEQTVLALPSPGACDTAYVRFLITNKSQQRRIAELHADVILTGESEARSEDQRIVDQSGRTLLTHSDRWAQFQPKTSRLTLRRSLPPGETVGLFFEIPYRPTPVAPLAGGRSFQIAYQDVRQQWNDVIAKGAQIDLPEKRIDLAWRALLLQNFVLADGARFTYGSGLRYNDSYFPVENGFGGHVFAMYGYADYADALLPFSVPVSVNRQQAGRKYQNRRALPLHHLFENYRLTGRTDVYQRYMEELHRVAEEIIADRRLTMKETDGARPLHWGFLPPDRPGVDLRASTQMVYVTAHNITNCQGLASFGGFLVRTGLDPERGRRYLEEARQFRRSILESMERSAIRLPGRPPFVDLQTLYFRETPEYGPAPYDDLAMGRLQGTYYHYWADMQYMLNFFNPADQVGQWIADYVAARGGFVLGATRARHRPEQPYGWINNVYNAGYYNYRLRSGRRDEFLLGFYSRLAVAHSRHTLIAAEGAPFIGYNTGNGGFIDAEAFAPNSAANAETLSMLRHMLVYEELTDGFETGNLHLLAGVPRAWLEHGKIIRVAAMPTYFGDVSLHLTSQTDARRIEILLDAPPVSGDVIIHLPHPQKARITAVRLDGANYTGFDAAHETLRLPGGGHPVKIEVLY